MANAFLLRPLPIVSVTVYGTVLSGQSSYVANDYAGVTCRAACDDSGNAAGFRFDLGADVAFDTVMLFGVTRFPSAGYVAHGYFTAAAPNTGITVGTTPPYAGSVARVDGLGVTLFTLDAPVTARYFQATFYAGSSGQSVEFSRITIGRRFSPGIGFEYGAQFGVRDLGSLDVNTRGVLLRHRGKKLRTVALNFPRLTKQEAESTAQKMLEQVGNTECIAVCTDPVPDAERQNRCYFGPLVGDLSRTWATASGHEVRLNLLGLM